jgi:hypothetical protein
MWVDQTDWEIQFLTNDAHWFEKIRIVRDKYSEFEITGMGIVQKVCRQIDIRTLFFRFDHTSVLLWASVRQRHHNVLDEETPFDDAQTGNGLQRSLVRGLADRLVRVRRPGGNTGRKVFDAVDLISGK